MTGEGIRVWGTMGKDPNGKITTFLSCAEIESPTRRAPPRRHCTTRGRHDTTSVGADTRHYSGYGGRHPDVGSRHQQHATNKRLSPFASRTRNVVRLGALASPTGGSQRTRPVIYSDSDGAPGALVATGPETVVTASPNGEWIPLDFAAPVALTPGTYWLGTITGTTSGATHHYIGTTEDARVYAWDPYTGGATDPAGPVQHSSGPISIYAEYTP